MTSPKYKLLWKGVESGPYSASEIQRMLKFGEIGIFHKIKADGMSDYVLLKDFDFSAKTCVASKNKNVSIFMEYVVYAIAGMSFLSLLFLGIGIVGGIAMWLLGYKSIARRCILLSVVIGSFGFIFFEKIYPTLIQ